MATQSPGDDSIDQRCRTIEQINELACSTNRVRILEQLADHRELHRDELRERVDVARTTLQRNLESLVDLGWVSNTGVEYAITPCGRRVAEEFSELVDTVAVTRRVGPALQHLDPDAFDLDLRHLADADVVLAEPGDPHAMINRHVQLLRGMDEGRGLLPFTGLHAFEAAHERVVEHGAAGELVVEPDVAEAYRSDPQYATLYEEMVDTGRFAVLVSDEPIAVPVAVIDGTVQLVVAEREEPRALLETDAAAVREWADRTYEEHRERATPLEYY